MFSALRNLQKSFINMLEKFGSYAVYYMYININFY